MSTGYFYLNFNHLTTCDKERATGREPAGANPPCQAVPDVPDRSVDRTLQTL